MYKGLKRAACALLIAVALYSLLGFLILPGIALRVANQQLAEYATVPARLERIQLNPFSLGTDPLGPAPGRRAGRTAGLRTALCQPRTGQPLVRRPAPGERSAAQIHDRSALRQGRVAQPRPVVQASPQRTQGGGAGRRSLSPAHRPHPTQREQPALPGPAPQRAGGVQLRLPQPGTDQSQHPSGRQHRHEPGGHRPPWRAHRLARPDDPHPLHVQRSAQTHRGPDESVLALRPRCRAAGAGEGRGEPVHRLQVEPRRRHPTEPGQDLDQGLPFAIKAPDNRPWPTSRCWR